MKFRFLVWALMAEVKGATVVTLGPILLSLTLVFVTGVLNE